MNPKISIIILNWNGKNDTIECLKSLKKINYPDYDVLVIDNGSTDNSAKVLKKKFPYIRLIRINQNQGYAEGNNIGIRKILLENPDYILLLSNDTIVDENFLEELVKVAESSEKIGIVCPKSYFYYKPNTIQFAGLRFNISKGDSILVGYNEEDKGQYDRLQEMDFCGGACMLVRKEVFEKAGLFDPSYFAYFEDTDFGFRVRKKGYKIIFSPKAKIWHKVSASTGGQLNPFKEYYMTRNNIIFMKKHADKRHFLTFLLNHAFVSALYALDYARKGKFELLKSRIKGFIDGIKWKK